MKNNNYRMVKDLINELKKFPTDSRAYAYEGEVSGIVIVYKNKEGCIHNDASRSTDLIKGYKPIG